MAHAKKKHRQVAEGENPLQGASDEAVQKALDKALSGCQDVGTPLTAKEVMEGVPADGVAEGRAHAPTPTVYGEGIGAPAIPKKYVLKLGKTLPQEDVHPTPPVLFAVATTEQGRDQMMKKVVNGLRMIEPREDTAKDGTKLYAVYVCQL